MTGWMHEALQGVRAARRQPGVSIPVVLAFALGIASTTAMFSVGYGILLNPYPYRDTDRIVVPVVRDTVHNQERVGFTAREIFEYQKDGRVFEAFFPGRQENVIIDDGRRKDAVMGALVSPNTFDELGTRAMIGRGITAADGEPGAEPVFAMGAKAWRRQFGADPAMVGRSYIVQGTPRTLVGIMPPRFAWGGGDVWLPVDLTRLDPQTDRRRFTMMARVRRGATEADVLGTLESVARRLAAAEPAWYPEQFRMGTRTLVDHHVGSLRTTLYALVGAVALLLLISCFNVAGLLTAHAVTRRRELAARAAIGASRGRLVTQLVLEGMTLALAGGALGCALAWLGLRALTPMLPEMTLPDEMQIGVNVPALAAAVAIATVAGLASCLVPALRITGRDPVDDLRGGDRVLGGRVHTRTRAILVLNQVVLSVVLLVGSGLLLRSFLAETSIDLGYEPRNILWTWIVLPPERYTNGLLRAQVLDEVVERLRSMPGARRVGGGQSAPPMGGVPSELDVGGTAVGRRTGDLAVCAPSYFDVLGIRRVSGRLYDEADVAQRRRVAVVNERFAHEFFRGEDPLGRRVKVLALERGPQPIADAWFEIVGVVADAKNSGVREAVVPGVYVPHSFAVMNGFGVFVRTEGDPLRSVDLLVRTIQSVQPNIVPQYTHALSTWLEAFYFARPRFSVTLLSIFTAVGLLLTSIGVYSVVAFGVARRHREIGIRMSLGATRRDVVRTVAGATIGLVVAGLAAGLALAAYLSTLLAKYIWGISPHDPATLVLCAALILAAGALACALPARRATRIDPVEALRSEV